MSTKMDEDDWTHTLAVFRACLPRRGRKAEDDRRFLEALHFFTVENVRWRALPERFGPWNSVWKRFDRLSKAGVFEAFFDTLASMSATAHLIQMFDSTGGRSKGGQEGQALGRSRGGFTTKIHAKSDASGDIIAFDLTGGQAFDGRHFEILLDIGPDIQPRAAICDKGYASKANRDAARARGIAPVIPHKANEKNKPAFFARTSTRPARASSRALAGSSASSALRYAAKRPHETSDPSSVLPPPFA
jgi:transposase